MSLRIDAHAHICPAFEVDALLRHMDGAGVHRAVLLQGSYYGDQNARVKRAVRAHPDRFAGALFLDPWADPALSALDQLADFAGVKLECSVPTGFYGLHPEARLDDDAVYRLCAALEAAGKVLTLDLGGIGSRSYETDAVAELAGAHPGLKIVLAHMGQPAPDMDAKARALWVAQISLGLLPNIWFDTASLPAYFAAEGAPYPGAARSFREALKIVGKTKLLWATDIPGLLTHAPYGDLASPERLLGLNLAEDAARAVEGENADRVYFR